MGIAPDCATDNLSALKIRLSCYRTGIDDENVSVAIQKWDNIVALNFQ
jgi:hypothetical protein